MNCHANEKVKMKKAILAVTTAVLCMLLLTACSGGGAKQYTVKLSGNPTTGYSWQYTMEPDGIVKEVSSDYVQNEAKEGMTGVPGEFIFVFEGASSGTVKLRFTYARPWEEGEISDDSAVYSLTVDKNLNISEN